jgi:hypothetical protein
MVMCHPAIGARDFPSGKSGLCSVTCLCISEYAVRIHHFVIVLDVRLSRKKLLGKPREYRR